MKRAVKKGKEISSQKCFVYKYYNDGFAYGDEYIEIFADKADAIATLREHVKEDYGTFGTMGEMKNDPEFKYDVLDDDYVRITNDGGDTNYYVIEEHDIRRKRV